MPLSARLWLVLVLALPAAPAAASEQVFRIDPVHTRVVFRVDHAGLSRAVGTFSGATGTLAFDPEDWSRARLQVRLPLASLDLGDADWNRKVLEPAFLAAGAQPDAEYVSTRVEPAGPDRAKVTGQLRLRGVTRELVLDVRLNALKRHPLTFRRTAGFSATGRLDRRDFGLDTWPNVIGHDVELLIEAEAIVDRAAPPPSEPESTDADPQ